MDTQYSIMNIVRLEFLQQATADRKVANFAQSSSRMGKDLAIGS